MTHGGAKAPPEGEALFEINERLGLDADFTVKWDELKFWLHTEDGRCKGYLNAEDCEQLAKAFSTLAEKLRAPHP